MRRPVKQKFSDRRIPGTPVGTHVRSLRSAKGWTLQELSRRSGISVAMLSKIERDERNPTVSVTWQIAGALDVPLSRLVGLEEVREVVVVAKRQRKIFRDDETGFERHVLSPIFPTRGVEFLFCVLPPRGRSGRIPAHPKSVDDYIVVTRGAVGVVVGTTEYALRQGDAIYYNADVDHEVINRTARRAEFYAVINSSRVNG